MNGIENILSFVPTKYKISTGKLLISEPFMPDYYFKRSVLLISEHDNNGSFGLIINKKTDYTIDEITNEIKDFKADVYLGGPVQTESLFFIHKRPDLISGSIEIIPRIFWGGNFEDIVEAVNNKQIEPEEIRFYLGYAGWGEKQLEAELSNLSWIVSPARYGDVFSKNPGQLWNEKVKLLGDKYQHWLNFPINPQLN